MKNTLADRLVFVFVGYLVTKCDSFVPGVWEKINPNSLEPRLVSKLGLVYFVASSDVKHLPTHILEITNAERLIKSGRHYRVDFEAVYSENENQFDIWSCHTEADENLNGIFQVQESTCAK